MDPTKPFVLLDDASRPGPARLLESPVEIVVATTPDEVRPALERLRQAKARGLWAAGFIGFEAGYALEPRLAPLARAPGDGLPLLWFGLFESVRQIVIEEVIGGRGEVAAPRPAIDQPTHHAAVEAAQALIAAGDIYQVNLTFPSSVETAGHPLALYAHLRDAAAAPYGAIIHTGEAWALSFSPELFFTLSGDRLTTKPMKGTARRAPTLDGDDAAAAALAADPKNRAENLMIVDLLRNDLSRVATGVSVDALFAVETYPTIHQMTSTISGSLRPGLDAVDVIGALFPCGSITGAPKIRAMEIIADLEPEPRGLYTGSIGIIEPSGGAAFNVAIRTLTIGGTTRIGLGSAIVADSEPTAEWDECLAKSGFLAAHHRFDLIETMRFENGAIARLDRHLTRLSASAAYWRFTFDPTGLRAALDDALTGRTDPARVRLVLSPVGNVAIQLCALPPAPTEPVTAKLKPLAQAPIGPRSFHKTSDRSAYRPLPGAFETLLVRPDGLLTEGCFTNLFVERDGLLLTPPLARGLLPGVLRAELLESGRAVETDLTATDLDQGFFLGNALRGLMRARLAQ